MFYIIILKYLLVLYYKYIYYHLMNKSENIKNITRIFFCPHEKQVGCMTYSPYEF